jgi:hypothetical protein
MPTDDSSALASTGVSQPPPRSRTRSITSRASEGCMSENFVTTPGDCRRHSA